MAKPCQGGVRPVKTKKLHRTLLALSVSLHLMSGEAWGREQLNMAFMQGGTAMADVDSYATFPAGRYLVDVELNGKRTGRRILDIPASDEQVLCLAPEWLNQAGIFLREDIFSDVRDPARGCYRVAQLPDTRVAFDFTTQTLEMHIPQKGLQKKPLTTEWEYGHSALRVNYTANASHSRAGSSVVGVTSLKANLGKWILDGAGSFTQTTQDINVATASRVLTSLLADLIIGRTSVGDGLLGSSGMLGATLQSNNSINQSAVGYSPVFSGVAVTPSRVTLIQGGRTIYTELVPAGPFEIRDVSLLGSNDVILVLTDEQGRETRERIPVARLAGQINPGRQEYSLSAGVVDKESGARNLRGALASLSYGRGFRWLSARMGVAGHSRYTGAGAELVSSPGVAGSLSLSASTSQARYSNGDVRRGERTGGGWAFAPATGARIQLSTSRQSADYTELGSFDPDAPGRRARRGAEEGGSDETRLSRSRQRKNEQTLQYTQALWGSSSMGLSVWQRDFWNHPGRESGLTARLSARPWGVGFSLGSTWSEANGRSHYAVSASVSVPFDLAGRRYNSSTSMTSGSGGSRSMSAGLSGPVTDRLSMGVSTGASRGGTSQQALDASWAGERVRASMMLNRNNAQTWSAGQVSGSVLAVPAAGSVVLSSNTHDTVAIAGVPDVKGVRFSGSNNNSTDSRGNVVIPLSGYLPNTISVDAASLPANVELGTTSHTLTPTSQAVVWLPFEVLEVNRYLLQVRQPDGEFVTPGTWAKSEKGTPLGFISHNGVLLINYVDKPQALHLGGCVIPTQKLKETDKLQEVICEN